MGEAPAAINTQWQKLMSCLPDRGCHMKPGQQAAHSSAGTANQIVSERLLKAEEPQAPIPLHGQVPQLHCHVSGSAFPGLYKKFLKNILHI